MPADISGDRPAQRNIESCNVKHGKRIAVGDHSGTTDAIPAGVVFPIISGIIRKKGVFMRKLLLNLLLLVSAGSVMGAMPRQDLEIYYPFYGEVFDESGNDRHGEPTGVLFVSDRHGVPVQACGFADDSQAIVLSDVCKPLGAHTISFRINPYLWTNANYPAVFGGRGLGNNDSHGGVAFTRYEQDLYYDIYDNDRRSSLILPIAAIPESIWTHVVLSWNGEAGPGAMKAYIDGALFDSADVESVLPDLSWGSFRFLLGNSGRGSGFRGMIDDFAVWSRDLSTEDIHSVYAHDEAHGIPDIDINLSGRVVEKGMEGAAGDPIEGAVVRLGVIGLRTQSLEDGTFALAHLKTGIVGDRRGASRIIAALVGDKLKLQNPNEGTRFEYGVFDLHGRLLLGHKHERLSKGTHFFPFSTSRGEAAGCRILRLRIGGKSFTGKVNTIGNRRNQQIPLNATESETASLLDVNAKSDGFEPAVFDTLLVMNKGYKTTKIPLHGFQESFGDILLESLSDATLASLSVSEGTLTPGFSASIADYTVSVTDQVKSIKITPATNSSASSIVVEGQEVASGMSSAPISLSEGENNLEILVTGGDGQTVKVYGISVVVSTTLPAAPSGCSATQLSTTGIKLQWNDNAVNETGYKIMRSGQASGSFADVGQVGAGVTTWTDSDVSPSSTYHYRIYSYNSAGMSSYCSCSGTTASLPQYALTLQVSPTGAGNVTAVPNQASYQQGTQVTISAGASAGYRFQSWSGDLTLSTNPAVVIMDAAKSITANFVQIPVLSGPSTVSGNFPLSATFAWSGLSDGSEYYEFEYSGTSASSGFSLLAKSALGTRTSPYLQQVLFDSGDHSGDYYFRVRVRTTQGLTPWSDVVKVNYQKPASSTITLAASADNLLVMSSAEPQKEKTVFKDAYLGVGQMFDIWPYSQSWIDVRSLIKFPLPFSLNGKHIVSAELRLYVKTLPADRNTTYRCGAVAGTWNTTTVTHNNHPSDQIYLNNRVSFSPPYSAATPVKIDITGIVQQWADGKWQNYGILLWDTNAAPPSQTTYRATEFYEESNGSNAPSLYIVYE